jgi:hypothetical protein
VPPLRAAFRASPGRRGWGMSPTPGDLPSRDTREMPSVPLSAPRWPAKLGIVIALDTLAYARRLRQAGFTEQQAEAQAEALAAVMVESLATKADLQELELRLDTRFARIDERFSRIDERFIRVDERFARVDERFEHLERQMETRFAEQTARLDTRFTELDGRISAQEARFDAKLADLERRLTMRLGGMMVAGIGVVSALVKVL